MKQDRFHFLDKEQLRLGATVAGEFGHRWGGKMWDVLRNLHLRYPSVELVEAYMASFDQIDAERDPDFRVRLEAGLNLGISCPSVEPCEVYKGVKWAIIHQNRIMKWWVFPDKSCKFHLFADDESGAALIQGVLQGGYDQKTVEFMRLAEGLLPEGHLTQAKKFLTVLLGSRLEEHELDELFGQLRAIAIPQV